VQLLDAEFGPLSIAEIIEQAKAYAPQAVLLGHSGSTSAHPTVAEITRLLRVEIPQAHIVYGGVFPTYHWRDVLSSEPQIDVVVRGEGEETSTRVMHALETAVNSMQFPASLFAKTASRSPRRPLPPSEYSMIIVSAGS
jgi:anaerobic magnesium-protoporphyrin IX monomethyl ester cyclase